MITKERLEELIKAEETIYTRDSDVHLLSRWHFVLDGKLYESHRYESEYLYDLEELFETEEDAEFALKYQNIPRTERLSLPTWEEIEKEYNKTKYKRKKFGTYPIIKFIGKDENFYSLNIFVDNYNRKEIDMSGFINKPLTKANYLQTCELCRKLFLGEVE